MRVRIFFYKKFWRQLIKKISQCYKKEDIFDYKFDFAYKN